MCWSTTYARQCVNTPWTQGPRTYYPVFPAVALALLFCPLPLQVFLSSLGSLLQLTNPDRGLLLATGSDRDLLQMAGSLLVFYVTPELFRPFTSPLLSFTATEIIYGLGAKKGGYSASKQEQLQPIEINISFRYFAR